MPVEYNQEGFNRLEGWMKAIHGLRVKVGWVGSAAQGIEEGSELTLAELALIHEYGTDTIPERAPLRRAMMENQAAIAALYRRVAYGVLTGKLTAEKACAMLGDGVAAMIKATIIAGLQPPNAPSTVARKGSSTPLIDDGQFVNAVTYEVVAAAGEAAAPAAAEAAA